MDHTDPAEALAAALATTQPAPEPADATAPGHDAGAVVAERRRLAALIDAAQATAPEDTQVRFDAHGFPHRDGQPVNWSDIR